MSTSDDTRYDHVFRGALIYDGTGAPPFAGEVAVARRPHRASSAPPAPFPPAPARTEHDLKGRALSPGFIDAHTHDDRIVLDAPDMLPKISQGVTTVVAGNCGISLAPVTFDGDPPAPMNLLGGKEAYEFPRFADYANGRRRDRARRSTSRRSSAIRRSGSRTMSDIKVGATKAEVAAMLDHVDEAMENGAAGFSTGLFYPTNAAADIDEVAPSRRASPSMAASTPPTCATRPTACSTRSTRRWRRRAGRRSRSSSRTTNAPHPRNWGRTKETLPVIEAASHKQPVAARLLSLRGGLDQPPRGPRHRRVPDHDRLVAPHPEMGGRDLADIAKEWGVDIHEAARRLDPAGAIYFQMDEDDVRRVMSFPLTMIGSDGLPHDAHPHPRLWGTFPRVIGHYARDEKLFPLETAIHKMTGLTAEHVPAQGPRQDRARRLSPISSSSIPRRSSTRRPMTTRASSRRASTRSMSTARSATPRARAWSDGRDGWWAGRTEASETPTYP